MIEIRPLLATDIRSGMALKERAGWNQVEGDWRRWLDLEPSGCFLASEGGRVVGTVTSCCFGTVGWIAMMLVEPEMRGRGIGRRLMDHALQYLAASGARSIRLDATPLGQPLYESLGFVAEATILRHAGRPELTAGESPREPLALGSLDEIAALDREACGIDRRRLLDHYSREDPTAFRIVRETGRLRGYAWSRPGCRARQIGPCISDGDDDAAETLLRRELQSWTGTELIIDIPESHHRARAITEQAGLVVTRGLTRMTRGPAVAERLARIVASSGPELG